MSELTLFLLGSPYIERNGARITVDTRKAIALLAYLAITGQRQRRDTLATLLWPDYDQPHAHATLRRTLWALNKALDGVGLKIDREAIELDRQRHLWIDVEAFHHAIAECSTHGHKQTQICAACLEPLQHAVSLYRADFLAGFNLSDSANFDDWQTFQSDSLRRSYAYVLERIAHCYSAQADFETAITYARQWLAIDHLHEAAHRSLMQFYAWAGQRAAALHQYEECVRLLDHELNVVPLEVTTQLYLTLKDNHAPLPPTLLQTESMLTTLQLSESGSQYTARYVNTSLATLHTTQYRYPLLGRKEEWQLLHSAYSKIEQSGMLIVIDGEAGIGKTRLAQELLKHVQRQGGLTITARSYEGESNLAYGLITSGLRAVLALHATTDRALSHLPTHWLQEVGRLLPELTPRHSLSPVTPLLERPGAQNHFFEGLRQMFLTLCQISADQPPGFIFFDDIQWADTSSIDFLIYLLRRLDEQPLCIVLTWRSPHISPPHRLYHLLNELKHNGQALHLSLARLRPSSIEQFVQHLNTSSTNTAPSPQARQIQLTIANTTLGQRLYQETEGLPLLLIEYLSEIAAGKLHIEEEYWPLPAGVRTVLSLQLVALHETSRQILSVAAVIGHSFDFHTLHTISSNSEEETVLALEELLNQGLIEEMVEMVGIVEMAEQRDSLDPTQPLETLLLYEFRYEKLRHLLYTEISQTRRRFLHRRIAETLLTRAEIHGEQSMLAEQIAFHAKMAHTSM
ncbi:hypothetical protein ccbrp13_27390 [Ktedonobacteria bacterium brp13]|nr:hypothetical protein ccbrp13_27390 [Ktedonobacteria bacterium brp13]